MAIVNNLQTANTREGVGKRKPPYAAGGNVSCAATVENSVEVA